MDKHLEMPLLSLKTLRVMVEHTNTEEEEAVFLYQLVEGHAQVLLPTPTHL